jgi:hypothetical protein
MKRISSAKIWNKSLTLIFICMFALLALSACGSETPTGNEINSDVQESVSFESADSGQSSADDKKMKSELTMKINGETVSVEWEDNESVSALRELAAESPVTVQTSLYGGFEQVGSIGRSMPRNDERITTEAGDIVLYSGNQMVVFYGSNTWAYTRLGHITDKTPSELTALLGNGNVTISISANH